MNKKELRLYIHIPFCVKKCLYCDFLSSAESEEVQEAYIKALRNEMEMCKEKMSGYVVTSIFLGGGTPSLIAEELMRELFATIHHTFDVAMQAEITIEVNPGTVDCVKLAAYYEIGINRISIGLQSTNNEELKRLGRIHTYEEFLKTYKDAKKVGFTNINIDLISAIPGQNCESWKNTLMEVVALEPTHISAYSLIIEEGTPYYERYHNKENDEEWALPSEEEDRKMYLDTQLILQKNGYERYEISNYAKPGYECKHNSGYWRRDEYLGIGIGAASLLDQKRFSNTSNLKEYIESYKNLNLMTWDNRVICNLEVLSPQEEIEEHIFLGLRMMEGIELTSQLKELYSDIIKELEHAELLEIDLSSRTYPRLKLTNQGISVSNYVLAKFLK